MSLNFMLRGMIGQLVWQKPMIKNNALAVDYGQYGSLKK